MPLGDYIERYVAQRCEEKEKPAKRRKGKRNAEAQDEAQDEARGYLAQHPLFDQAEPSL